MGALRMPWDLAPMQSKAWWAANRMSGPTRLISLALAYVFQCGLKYPASYTEMTWSKANPMCGPAAVSISRSPFDRIASL
jgi:hypothetical protein